MNLLSQAHTTDPFGTINSPISSIPTDPNTAIGSILSLLLKIFMLIALLAMGLYLLLGAFEWITSGGEKEKLTKAQGKIMNAVIGIFILIVVLSVFCVVTVNILKITDSCLNITLPQISP